MSEENTHAWSKSQSRSIGFSFGCSRSDDDVICPQEYREDLRKHIAQLQRELNRIDKKIEKESTSNEVLKQARSRAV
jgi:hypothetical protein